MRLDKILLLYDQSLQEGKVMKTLYVQQNQLLKINSFNCRDHDSVCRS